MKYRTVKLDSSANLLLSFGERKHFAEITFQAFLNSTHVYCQHPCLVTAQSPVHGQMKHGGHAEEASYLPLHGPTLVRAVAPCVLL